MFLTVAIGVGEDESIEELAPRVAADNIRVLIEEDPEKLERTVERVQSRYHFLDKRR